MVNIFLSEIRNMRTVLRKHGIVSLWQRALLIGRKSGWRVVLSRARNFLNREREANGAFPGPRQLIEERTMFCARPNVVKFGVAKSRKEKVIILSDTELDQCIRYRIKNKVETLSSLGIDSEYVRLGDLYRSMNQIQYCSSILFYRAPLDDLFMIYQAEARRLGVRIGYDIDDPIFEPSVLMENSGLGLLPSHVLRQQIMDAVRFKNALCVSDFVIASTPRLAETLRESIAGHAGAGSRPPVYLWRNAVDQRSLELGGLADSVGGTGEGEVVTLGYFSGSLAHEADFQVVAPALDRLMQSHSNVRLVIGGHAERGRLFSKYSSRVRFVKFGDYESYLSEVSRCDLVMVPLTRDRFNNAKSIVRMLDAAVVRRPVIASSVGDYEELIQPGQNGWLSADEQWYDQLTELVSSKVRLRDVGEKAHFFTKAYHSTRARPADWGAGLGRELRGVA